MELKDTIELMNSSDYKERFKAEYYQLKVRYEKLHRFCNNIAVAAMMCYEGPKHDCPLSLLLEQKRLMGMYLNTLEKRAIIEKIEL